MTRGATLFPIVGTFFALNFQTLELSPGYFARPVMRAAKSGDVVSGAGKSMR